MNELDILTDTLNEVLERAEVALSRYKVAAQVEVDDFNQQLGFKKVGTKSWCLVWFTNDGYVKVLDSSRKSRITAAENVPKLYEAILAQRSEVIEQTRKAVETLEAFVETLELEQPDG